MGGQRCYWALAPTLNEVNESITATTNHTNEAKTSPAANTWYNFTAGNIIPIRVEGHSFRIDVSGQVATAVATVTTRFEASGAMDPKDSNAIWTPLDPISHTFAATAATEYEGANFASGPRWVRAKDFQSTGTGNLSVMNAKVTTLAGQER